MKKQILGLLAVILLAGYLQPSQAKQPIVMKFPHVADENTPKGQMARKFKELVDKRLDGRVIIELYPNGSLYNDSTVLEAMLLGDVQIAAPSVSKFGSYCKGMQVFDLPFLFESRTAVTKFQKSPEGQHLLADLAENGFIGLGYLNDGFKVLSANRPLVAPADATGLRFRVQPSRVLASQFRAIDAIPVKMPFSQVTSSFQDNVIDGQENTWVNIFTRNIFKNQPFITEADHGIVSFLVVVSATFWQSLEETVRLELQRSLEEAIDLGNSLVESSNNLARQEIAAAKTVKIIALSEAERSQWKMAMRPVWRQFTQELGQEIVETAYRSN